MEPNAVGLFFIIVFLLVLIVLQARKPIKRRTQAWPEPQPPQLLHVMSMSEIPLSYYAAGNAVVLDRTLLIFDGNNWVEPKQSGCPTCGRPYA